MLAAMPRSPTASTAPVQRSFGWAPTQVRPGPVKVSSCPVQADTVILPGITWGLSHSRRFDAVRFTKRG